MHISQRIGNATKYERRIINLAENGVAFRHNQPRRGNAQPT
jgi:hypothetical protein